MPKMESTPSGAAGKPRFAIASRRIWLLTSNATVVLPLFKVRGMMIWLADISTPSVWCIRSKASRKEPPVTASTSPRRIEQFPPAQALLVFRARRRGTSVEHLPDAGLHAQQVAHQLDVAVAFLGIVQPRLGIGERFLELRDQEIVTRVADEREAVRIR